jgi:FixJ family two-component response regulator
MTKHEVIVEVSHLAIKSRPVLRFRRRYFERRQAGAGCRSESRPHRAAPEEGPVPDVPVIAIVDDDASFREALERFLGTFAFRVRSFASGEEFLASSELRFVSCLLLDLVMPGMNGLEVTQQLSARGLRIPTVFVTAHADDDVGRHLGAAGAIAILPKPVDQQMLLRMVRRVVGEQ